MEEETSEVLKSNGVISEISTLLLKSERVLCFLASAFSSVSGSTLIELLILLRNENYVSSEGEALVSMDKLLRKAQTHLLMPHNCLYSYTYLGENFLPVPHDNSSPDFFGQDKYVAFYCSEDDYAKNSNINSAVNMNKRKGAWAVVAPNKNGTFEIVFEPVEGLVEELKLKRLFFDNWIREIDD